MTKLVAIVRVVTVEVRSYRWTHARENLQLTRCIEVLIHALATGGSRRRSRVSVLGKRRSD